MLDNRFNFRSSRSVFFRASLSVGFVLTVLPGIVSANPVYGQIGGNAELHWIPLVMSLLGGLALFLYGMEKMATGLKSAVGAKMKGILARFTSNRLKAAITGSLVTAVIQSSSVTTVLTVGFVSAGLMSLSQSVGIIMGANVGTTITAQIIAFKVEKIALALIAVGFVLLFQSKNDLRRQLGNILMGLGLVFFGMGLMSEGVNPLRSHQPFVDLMVSMQNPIFGIFAGALFTALVQSSSATTGIVIALASQGLIELPTGISLIFGANIGTCVTALLATIGKSREALRVAVVHVIFNVFGVVLWVAFIPQLVSLVQWFSPGSQELEGAARLAADVPRQVANAHTIFNISNTLLLLPFTTLLARLANTLVRDKPPEPLRFLSKLLDENVLTIPSVALQNVRLETSRLGNYVLGMMQRVTPVLEAPEMSLLVRIKQADDDADQLQAEILKYAGQLRKQDLTNKESEEFRKLMIMNDALERIGDVVSSDIVKICRKKIRRNLKSSDLLNEMVRDLQLILIDLLKSTVELIRNPEDGRAKEIIGKRTEIEERIETIFSHQELRFKEVEDDRVPLFRIEMDLVEKQRRIFGLIERIAQQI